MSGPPIHEKAPVCQDRGALSENRNDPANHRETTAKASGSWFRCSACSALSHHSVLAGLADTTRCLSCGHEAVPCVLGRGAV